MQKFFAQRYTCNCKPPVAARAAATAAGVKGRRNISGSEKCKKTATNRSFIGATTLPDKEVCAH